MGKQSIYERIRNRDDIVERLRRVKPLPAIDRRRLAIEDAHTLAQFLGMDVPVRKLSGALNLPGHTRYVPEEYFYLRAGAEDTSVSNPRIEAAIEASRSILELRDDWDEEGSPGYSNETWDRATQFVRRVAWSFKNACGRWIDAPKITPGPDGSIDVRWKTQKRSLLINFPADGERPADFFGSDRGTDTIKGTLDLSSPNQWLLMWLTR